MGACFKCRQSTFKTCHRHCLLSSETTALFLSTPFPVRTDCRNVWKKNVPYPLSDNSRHFDLHSSAEGKRLDGHAGTGGRVDRKHLGIGGVDQREIFHVGDEDSDLDHVFDRRPRFGKERPDVFQALFRLGADPFGKFSRGGINAELTGEVQRFTGFDSLRIRADGCGGPWPLPRWFS